MNKERITKFVQDIIDHESTTHITINDYEPETPLWDHITEMEMCYIDVTHKQGTTRILVLPYEGEDFIGDWTLPRPGTPEAWIHGHLDREVLKDDKS